MAGREAERSLEQAGELRRRDPRRALAMYRRMLAAGGPLAEIAQYEIGVIEDEDLRNPRQAVATWDRYRARYPGGLLRTEADLSVIEALSRTGDQARALVEARDFLQRHPNSERRSEVARLAGDLARERGDCAAAVALYDQALSSRPATDDADDASFHRAACLARAGDARGSAGLRAYLKRFPLGRHAGEAQRLLSGRSVPAGAMNPRRPLACLLMLLLAGACARRTEIIGRLPDGAVVDGPGGSSRRGVDGGPLRSGATSARSRRLALCPAPAPLPGAQRRRWNCGPRLPAHDQVDMAVFAAARCGPAPSRPPVIVYPVAESVHPTNLRAHHGAVAPRDRRTDRFPPALRGAGSGRRTNCSSRSRNRPRRPRLPISSDALYVIPDDSGATSPQHAWPGSMDSLTVAAHDSLANVVDVSRPVHDPVRARARSKGGCIT